MTPSDPDPADPESVIDAIREAYHDAHRTQLHSSRLRVELSPSARDALYENVELVASGPEPALAAEIDMDAIEITTTDPDPDR